ncbi:MAG TPA: DUF4157 domain-containing protein [Leptolyngbyaceae cyanobacterium M33_DOE_097]|uniref:DUF4157 domain-containing protein n=1 Tax=Oscillatoriales cyanobacterium SpSt-418 TaxID=2282169 RepID=A0A7C3PI33_9CYAN|nr:DUF4157 domain-containing protein [Leptolyngbyaceae cyanobacterium M33_DOE_097]
MQKGRLQVKHQNRSSLQDNSTSNLLQTRLFNSLSGHPDIFYAESPVLNETHEQPSKLSHSFGQIPILAAGATVQAKLTVGQPDDGYEQAADRMAEHVMSSPTPPAVQRQAALEEDALQAKGETTTTQAPSDVEQQLSASQGGGSPLPETVRSQMEPKFGFDFSQVRVHTDGTAVQMSREIGAQAFTHGTDIYFNAGHYSPSSHAGQKLLAHELTHVVQQSGGKSIQRKLDTSSNSLKSIASPSLFSHTYRGILNALQLYERLYQLALEVKNPLYDYQSQLIGQLDILQNICIRWLEDRKNEDDRKTEKLRPALEKLTYSDILKEKQLIAGGMKFAEKGEKLEGGQVGNVEEQKANGTDTATVFKEDPTEALTEQNASAALESGIPSENNRLSNRAVATSLMDELFKTNIIVDTNFASKGPGGDIHSPGETFGIGMEKASGKSPQTITPSDMSMQRDFQWNDPEFSRKMQMSLATLQILDMITGQVDRHPGNYFIANGANGPEVKGIDNDFAFGVKANTQESIGQQRGLPVYLDITVAQQIAGIEEKQIRDCLRPLLTPQEIDKTVERWKNAKKHIEKLAEEKRLISPNEWNDITAQEQTKGNSYFGVAKAAHQRAAEHGYLLSTNEVGANGAKLSDKEVVERLDSLMLTELNHQVMTYLDIVNVQKLAQDLIAYDPQKIKHSSVKKALELDPMKAEKVGSKHTHQQENDDLKKIVNVAKADQATAEELQALSEVAQKLVQKDPVLQNNVYIMKLNQMWSSVDKSALQNDQPVAIAQQ